MKTLALSAILLIGGSTALVAHDIYNGVRDQRGVLCCGGDPVTGDCESLEAEQIQFRRDGIVRMYSKRYRAWISVGEGIVLPTSIPGDKGAAGHYCGVPREKAGRATDTPTADQPDTRYYTFCAFVAPPGT